jgi:hypothetical protein
MDSVSLRVPTKKIGYFPPSTSVISQDLALQQGKSQPQTASVDIWMFPINKLSPWGIFFPFFNDINFMAPVTS